jgi:hypothetical protein
MQRRRFLSVLGLSALAGCPSSGSTASSTETTTYQESTAASQATATPAPTTTATAAERQTHSQQTEAIREDFLAAFIGFWAYKNKLRYYNASVGELDFYNDGENAFYSVSIVLRNLGSDDITDIPERSDFSLISGSESYDLAEIPPDGSSWSILRQRPGAPQLNPSLQGLDVDKIPSGERTSKTLHYVAPPDPNWSLDWSLANGDTHRIEPSSPLETATRDGE